MFHKVIAVMAGFIIAVISTKVYLASTGRFDLYWVATAGAFGAKVGSVVAWVGMKHGEHWRTDPRRSSILHTLDLVIVGTIVAGAIWFAWHRVKTPARR